MSRPLRIEFQRMKEKLEGMTLKTNQTDIEIPQMNVLENPPSISEITSLVCQALEIPAEALQQSGTRKASEERAIAIYLCRNVGGWPLKEIAGAFGGCRYSAISNAVLRVKKKLTTPSFKKQIVELEEALGKLRKTATAGQIAYSVN